MQTVPLVDEYLAHCRLRGLSDKTVSQYQWALNRLSLNCPELPHDGFDLVPLIGDGSLRAESRRDLLKCLKAFFNWAELRHRWPNPCKGLTPPRRRTQTRRILTREEIAQLFAAALSTRDRALVLVILDCGLRLGEVANLRQHHVRDGWLVVSGKTGERQVPVSSELAALLGTLGADEHLWIGRQGPLTREGIVLIYRRMFDRASITGPKTGPHTLRHTFGTFYIREGGGVRQLQQIMGHSRIETTMIYVHLAGTDVAADHAIHSPARSLGLVSPSAQVAPLASSRVAIDTTAGPPTRRQPRGNRQGRRGPSAETNTLHCPIPSAMRRHLGYLMTDDDTGLTDQIIRAVIEYVGNRTGAPFQRPLRTTRRLGTAEFTCKIPSDLYDYLRGLMLTDHTGISAQVTRAVREYVGRRAL